MVEQHNLKDRLAASHYLSTLANRYPNLAQISGAAASSKDSILSLQKVCERTEEFIQAGRDSIVYEDVEKFLIASKAEFSFNWSIAEMTREGDFSARGYWQTKFAELTIDLALKAAWSEVGKKHKSIQLALTENEGQMPGLFVFGMGKLGGRDLNFSSDVDLVAYFDPEVLQVPETLGKSYICHQALQKLTQLLVQNNRSDFVWRVDWRLRPNASATTLAMSTDIAEEYYFFRASPWHRLALMKARVVAGDRLAGQQFLDRITPFIWRQNLDYRALDELAEIKNRINLEHPTLKVERQWRQPINQEIGGYNVKLGTGGIREIEFVVNALQLLWGGKKYSLRTSNTLEAIAALESLEHFTPELANDLASSYKNLRRIENAIQISGNQHTHLVPKDQSGQASLLLILGENSWANFVENLNFNRTLVSKQFEALFAEQDVGDTQSISWPEGLSAPALEIVTSWENGFRQYGVSPSVRQKLKPLSVALAHYLADLSRLESSTMDPSVTVVRLHDFFRTLPQGEQYFRMLAESPKLLESIVPPLLYSPAMSILLKQSPHIIDCYMSAPLDPQADYDSDYVLEAQQYEIRLERMRRFVNEHLYQLYLMFLQGELTVESFQHSLSSLAEHTLELALKVVSQNMQLSELPIAILGMGKVALRRMSPLSDLDLIFIYDQKKMSLELATKFVSRLQTAIATPMREGIVYELDTRLRPSGKSGAPIVSIDSFASHQLKRAHSWEHIALVPSRVVAGDLSLLRDVHQVKREVISRQRNNTQLIRDAIVMWERVSEHRLREYDSSVMFSKLRPGGLMQSEYLSACLLLNAIPNATGKLPSIEYDDLLSLGAKSNPRLTDLAETMQFWRVQQLWERLLGFTEQPLENLPSDYLERLLFQSRVTSLPELLEKKQDHANLVIGLMDEFFQSADPQTFDQSNWIEKNVAWQG